MVVLDQVPTPYRAPLYRLLHEDDRSDVEFTIHFCGETADFRSWRHLDLDFPHSFLRGWEIHPRLGTGQNYQINAGILRLLRTRPDAIIVSGWAHPTCLIAALAARRLNIPYLITSESHAAHRRSPMGRLARRVLFAPIVRRASASLATGSRARDYLVELGVRPETIFIRPNACDVNAIAEAVEKAKSTDEAARMRAQISPNLPIIAFAGRLIEAKGVDVLLDALAIGRARGQPLACVIVGDGRERTALEERAAHLGLTDVSFAGEIAPDRLPALYAAVDILCLPSRDEPWGVVVNEAMSAGLRVVVSDVVGAAPDLIRPGQNGDIFASGDPASLADALLRTLELDPVKAAIVSREVVAQWGQARALSGMYESLRFVFGDRTAPVSV